VRVVRRPGRSRRQLPSATDTPPSCRSRPAAAPTSTRASCPIRIGKALGQTIVTNRPGAGSSIGPTSPRSPSPTAIRRFGTISLTINPAVYKKLPFDAQRDLVPITRVGPAQHTRRSSVAAGENVPGFPQLARAQSGKVTFGSAGTAPARTSPRRC
jgi:tripartite-type tricarboxylate transporter receptor subunit TctC